MIKNFKPTLWEGAIIANFHNASVSANGALSAVATDVSAEKVRFTAMGDGVIKDYTGTIAWDDVKTSNIDLIFDKQKYFAFKVDDVDEVQLRKDLMLDVVSEHSGIMAELYDKNFYTTLIGGALPANTIGTKTTKEKVTVKNAYDYIVDLSTKLSKNKVPKQDRFVSINSEFLGLLSKDARFTNQPKILKNGVVDGQVIANMKVVVCEEVPAGQVVAHYKKAIGTGSQIDKTESMRLEDSFSDGVRGLQKYGAVVLIKDAIALLNYEITV